MGTPVTTIPPFNDQSKLPACAKECGPLFDVNGGCVPPAVPAGSGQKYVSCFCANAKVSAFSSGTAGVCDTACTADSGGLQSIAKWFQGICSVQDKGADGGAGATSKTAGASSSSSTSSAGDSSSDFDGGSGSSGNNGDWLSNHWQWVVMLVVLVVGIAGIWIGACIWRRRYLRKKDRQFTLGQKHSGSATNPSWGPEGANSFGMSGHVRDSTRSTGPLMAGSGPMSAFEEEKPNKAAKVRKWIVN